MTTALSGLTSLMTEVLARRDTDSRYRASVARGLDETTEHYAFPWVLRWVYREQNRPAYLRAAGLAARYADVPHAPGTPFGASLRRLSLQRSNELHLDPQKPDLIAARLASFQEQDFEQAVSTIRRFLDLARGTGVHFDFVRLAGLLAQWGTGFDERSLAVRSRTIGDYYGAWTFDRDHPDHQPGAVA